MEARVFAVEDTYLAGGNHARSASSRRRYYAVKIVRRRRRSPWALDRGNFCSVVGQTSNRNTRIWNQKRCPRQCCRRCRTAAELSISGTECARLARMSISARVMGGSKAHSRSRSGGRRGRRARDTTMVIRGVCVIVVTVYLALNLVVPSRLT